jgi:hypothetical protein
MACDTLHYSGVDNAKWNAAREAVSREYGMDIGSEQGEDSKKGFRLRWSYDAQAQTLEIQCIDKPRLIPCGIVSNRINALADGCGIAPA